MLFCKINKNKNFYLITKGGFGNQCFQVLYGLCFSTTHKGQLRIIHNDNFRHKFQLSSSFNILKTENRLASIFASLKIIPILDFLKITDGSLKLFNNYYIEGYFQEKDCYSSFDVNTIQGSLKTLQKLAWVGKINRNRVEKKVLHLRLGDFFHDNGAKVRFLEKSFADMDGFDYICSNETDLIRKFCLDHQVDVGKIEIVDSPEDLLKIGNFNYILFSNGSTYSFWLCLFSMNRWENLDTSDSTELSFLFNWFRSLNENCDSW